MSPEPEPEWIMSALARARAESAPAQLRERLDRAGRPIRRRPGRTRRIAATAGTLFAALALILVLALAGSGPGAPTVARAAELVAASHPSPGARYPSYYNDVRFPRALLGGHWQFSGETIAHLDGHTIVVLAYRDGVDSVTYAIAAAPLLSGQHRGFTRLRAHGRTVISWQRSGHSCLLSGDLQPAALRAIAES